MSTPADAIPPLSFEGVKRLIGWSVSIYGKKPAGVWRGQIIGTRFVGRDEAILILHCPRCKQLPMQALLSNVAEWVAPPVIQSRGPKP